MAIPDVSTDTIYEGELPNVDSMSEVTHVRVITSTGSGSEKVPIDEFTLPASQITNDSGVAGATVDDALTQLNTAKASNESVEVEKTERIAGDNALQASIENLSGEIGSESLARTAGDNALQASIDQEISDRQTAIQGVVQTVNSNTEEIQNEITNRTQTVNALRNELLSKTIGSIETGAEQKPAEGVSRRYRFTNDGNCYFTDVLNGLTFDVMPVPFVVSKDDELSVIQYGENYTYIYHKIASNYATKVEIGNISSALDEILLIGGSI